MTHTRTLLTVALVAVLSVGLAGCAKKKPAPAAPLPPSPAATPAPPPPPTPPPSPAPPSQPSASEQDLFNQKTLEQLNAEKPLSDVFFALDSSDLTDEGRSALQKDSEWMRKWTTTKVTVEGHCDSRGTAEYNLALGDRRASAVKAYLAGLGVGSERILTLSKGKEAPVCTDENESCWSQNRRGHFIITAK